MFGRSGESYTMPSDALMSGMASLLGPRGSTGCSASQTGRSLKFSFGDMVIGGACGSMKSYSKSMPYHRVMQSTSDSLQSNLSCSQTVAHCGGFAVAIPLEPRSVKTSHARGQVFLDAAPPATLTTSNFLQSGLHVLAPGIEPNWPAHEGVVPWLSHARSSHLMAPRTITCFHGAIPASWHE